MKNKMAKPLGVTPASRGRAPSIRICIPDDLQEIYGGRSDFRISLGKVDWATAKTRATTIRAGKEAEFAAKRPAIKAAASLAPEAVVTPELAKTIAQGVAVPFVVVGDGGPRIGEGSPALARQVSGLQPSDVIDLKNRFAGQVDGAEVLWVFFGGSALPFEHQNKAASASHAKAAFETWGGAERLMSCLRSLPRS